MKPSGNRVIVKPILETGKPSRIITPEIAKRMPTEGVIVAIGEFRTPMGEPFDSGLRVGHRISFVAAGPTQIMVDGEIHLVVDERDVLVDFDLM